LIDYGGSDPLICFVTEFRNLGDIIFSNINLLVATASNLALHNPWKAVKC